MSKSLQDLRRSAGFGSSKEFAEEMGLKVSTYARYEQICGDPDNGMPVKAAWAIADRLGCSIDMVVGREEPDPTQLRGEVQTFYDGLSPENRALLDEFMAFVAQRQAAADERARRIEEADFDRLLGRFERAYFASAEDRGDDMLFLGTHEQTRRAFEEFVAGKVAASAAAYEDAYGSGEEVVGKVMAAYDRRYPEPGGSVTYAYVKLPV